MFTSVATRGWILLLVLVGVAGLGAAGPSGAASAWPPPAQDGPTYWQDIRPLLRKNCTYCHSARLLSSVDVSGGLALDTWQAVRQHVDATLDRVTHGNPEKRMPKDADPLTEDEMALLKTWRAAGMPEGKPDTPTPTPTAPRRVLKTQVMSLPTTLTAPPGWRGGARDNTRVELRLEAPRLAPITALAYSADGQRLAVGAFGQVVVWHLAQAAVEARIEDVLGSVNDLAFSPDGSLLAVAGGQPSARGDLRLFRTSDWKLKAGLGGHLDTVAAIAFSPDGSLLASASLDKKVKLWDLAAGKPRLTLEAHSDGVCAVCFTPDGKHMVTGSRDRSLRRIEVATGQADMTFTGAGDEVLTAALRPGGDRLFAGAADNNVLWWDARTGVRVRAQFGHGGGVNAVTFTADGQTAASGGGDGQVRLWQAANGNPGAALRVGTPVFVLAFAPDGKRLAVGGFDGRVQLWDPTANRLAATLLSWEQGEDDPWLALAPEGWFHASEGLAVTLRSGSQPLVADRLREFLIQVPQLAAALTTGPSVPVALPPEPVQEPKPSP